MNSSPQAALPAAREPLPSLWSRLSLRSKLVVILLAVALLPLLAAALINDQSARQSALGEANQRLLGSAESVADQIDKILQAGLDNARYQAHLPTVTDYMRLPAEQRANSPEEERLLDFMLTAAREDPVYITSIAVLDAQGVSLLDTSAAEVGVSNAEREYFRRAAKSGFPYASSVEFDHVTGKPSLYFIAPIQGKTDLGFVRIRYDALILQDLITRNSGRAGEGSLAMLFDERHIQLAHGMERENLYQPIVPLKENLAAELRAKRLLPPQGSAAAPQNLARLETGLANFFHNPTFGAPLTNGEAQIAVAPAKNGEWLAAFAQPQAVILAPVNAQTRRNFAAAFALAVGMAFFGLLLAEALAASVIRLTESKAALLAAQPLEEESPIPVLLESGAPFSSPPQADGVLDVKTKTAPAPLSTVVERAPAQVAAKTSPRKARAASASEDQLEVAIQRLGLILSAAKVSADGDSNRQEKRS